MKLRTLSIPEVLFIHSAIIDETGGAHGVRDLGLLESAVRQIEQSFAGQDLYPSLIQKAAALFVGLVKNHPFVDGNKRTAIVAMGVFLELNGMTLKVDPVLFTEWAEHCAESKLEQAAIVAWIEAHASRKK